MAEANEKRKVHRKAPPEVLLTYQLRTFVTQQEGAACDRAAFASGVRTPEWLRNVVRAALNSGG